MRPPRSVVVIGDALLDVDVEGTVDRLCPDAPAPVLAVTGELARPGGAGLAAALVAGRGVPVRLVTALEADESGERLRGLLDGVLPAVVEALRARGAQRISAQIGPCVCAQCYEVPEQMAEESEQSLPGIRTTTRWGTPGLDLPGAAARQLEQLGVQVEVVAEDSPRCTLENEGLSSHRRDPSSGRIAGIVVPVS